MIGTLKISKVFAGLEQIYLQECLAIDAAMQRTVARVLEMHRDSPHRFAEATTKALSQLSKAPPASGPQSVEKMRSALLREVLLAGQRLALKIETLIEANLKEEAERLNVFAVTVDRIHRHLTNGKRLDTKETESPSAAALSVLGCLEKYPATYGIDVDHTSSFMGDLKPFSAYGIGALTSLLATFTLYRKLADLDIDAAQIANDPSDTRVLSARLRSVIAEVLDTERYEQTETLTAFVEAKFAGLKHEIAVLLERLGQNILAME